MPLFLHSCWLIVQINLCYSVGFFFPASAVTDVCSANDMSIDKLMLTIHVPQNVYVGITVLQVNPLSLLKGTKVMMVNACPELSRDFTVLSRAIVNGQQMGRLLKVMSLFQRGVIQVSGWKSKLLGSGLFRTRIPKEFIKSS